MPPKPKFTREEIVASAVDLVSKKGIDYLTTRNLGEWMGSSARPIFTVFNSMDEVIREVRKAATEKFNSYIREIVNSLLLSRKPEYAWCGSRSMSRNCSSSFS